MSVRGVIDLLQSGKTVVRRLTVVEGWSTAQIFDQLRAVDGLDGEITIKPAEGALLPETYHFSFGDERNEMVRRMMQAMSDLLDEAWSRRAADLPLKTRQEALVLASIVEKETGLPEERARIAGVFINRLRKGMPLQSDPTVVYALTQGNDALRPFPHPFRSPHRIPLQHLSRQGPAAGTDLQSRQRCDPGGPAFRWRPRTCISSPTAAAGICSPVPWANTTATSPNGARSSPRRGCADRFPK